MTNIITPEGYKPGDVMSQEDFDKLYNRESASINNNDNGLVAFSGMETDRGFLVDYDESLFAQMNSTTYLQVIYADKEMV